MRINKYFVIVGFTTLTFLIIGAVKLYAGIFKKAEQPNVLLITVDALRPNHLGCYGYKRETSPNIDKIAKGGATFNQTITQASLTPPSITSIMTSVYPVVHKVYSHTISFPSELISLTDILKSQGYITAFMTNFYLFKTFDAFEKEFDIFFGIDTYKSLHGSKPVKFREITSNVINQISENRRKPFFLWVHFMDTHQPPLSPPSPYDKLFINDRYSQVEIDIPVSNCLVPTQGFGGLPQVLVRNNNDITNLNYYISLYDGAIRYVDEQIGLLLETLKKLRLDKKTLVIISADHGEGLGEHNVYFFHGPSPGGQIFHPESHFELKDRICFHGLYDEDIKVPLIIKYPRLIPQGKKIGIQVQSVDITPTLLDILDIEKPEQMVGKSLLPLIKNKNIEEYEQRFAFSSIRNDYAVRTNDYKLIYCKRNNSYELYNLKTDPQEMYNLIGFEKEITYYIKLKQELDKYMAWISPVETKEVILDEKERERLKSFGYLQ